MQIRRVALAVLAVMVAVCAPWLYVALTVSHPLGYAGLYVLMGTLIAHHGPALPESVPWYGPGGIPFAYPPLALYVMAGAIGPGHVPALVYLRLAPIIFLACAAPLLVLFYSALTASRSRAMLATVFVLTVPGLLSYQIFADGVVRGLAYLFTIGGLYFAYRALNCARWSDVVAAGILGGLTALSHPENTVFYVLTVVIFTLFAREPAAWRAVTLMALVGAVVSAPWWAVVLHRYGLVVLWNAFHTHGGIGVVGEAMRNAVAQHGIAGVLLWPVIVLFVLANGLIPTVPLWWPMYVAAGYGLVLLVVRRRFLLPAWYCAIALLMPDGSRFWATIAALIAAVTILDLSEGLLSGRQSRPAEQDDVRGGRRTRSSLLLPAAFALWSLIAVAFWALHQRPLLTSSDEALSVWMQRHTPPESRYLALTRQATEQEWIPYLSHRTPAISPWGAEWVGRFNRENVLEGREARCLRRQSLQCVDRIARASGFAPRYLIVTQPGRWPRLVARVDKSVEWRRIATVGHDIVWKRSARL